MTINQIKICPDCATEYFAYIANCADCGTTLLFPEEYKKLQDEKKSCQEKTLEDSVAVRKGELKWIEELSHVLIDSYIPCVVHAEIDCNKKCCGDSFQLLVSSKDAEKARELINEYYAEIHPEIQASQEMASQGKCPACGSPVGSDAVECPDCGLTLFIIE